VLHEAAREIFLSCCRGILEPEREIGGEHDGAMRLYASWQAFGTALASMSPFGFHW
jgi:hypothetical protein